MESIEAVVTAQHVYFEQGNTLPLPARRESLLKLRDAVQLHEEALLEALWKDLGKAPFESWETEVGLVLAEIRYQLTHLGRLARPQRVGTPLVHFPSRSRVLQEPYGVALIISPWNYPVQLTLEPLTAALAAGNCAVVKPSSQSPHVAAALAALLGETFDPRLVFAVSGSREENAGLLDLKFEKIFFTGSAAAGRTILTAASRHLTPVTLELGGKSPCLVDETVDIPLTARRIIWGKCLNAGQTCVAPDYVLVQESVKDALVGEMARCVRRFYGEDPLRNPEYPHIVSRRQFDRLCELMKGQTAAFGTQTDPAALKIALTVLVGCAPDSAVMQQEIFGPILPVLGFETLDGAVRFVKARPRPLALYLFTRDKRTERAVLFSVPFGGGCVNDTIVHLATSHMPFGGVGESGMGGYHGRAGFEAFSHEKSVLFKSARVDVPLRYPPYGNRMALLRRIMKWFPV